MAVKDSNRTSAGKCDQIVARRNEAWKLRQQGLTFQKIGQRLGVSPATACLDVHAVRDEWAQESKELCAQYIAQHREELEAARSAILPYLTSDHWEIESLKETENGCVTITVEQHKARMAAVSALVKIQNQEAALLGLHKAGPYQPGALGTGNGANLHVHLTLDELQNIKQKHGEVIDVQVEASSTS